MQIRMRADAVNDPQVLVAIQAAATGCERLGADFEVHLTADDGWFLDVTIGRTPFAPEQDLIASNLLRTGVPFDIAYSNLGTEGEPVATLYGLHEGHGEIHWTDDAVSLERGTSSRDIDPRALASIGIEVAQDHGCGETLLYSPSIVEQLERMNPRMVKRLVDSIQDEGLLHETARYLARRYERRLIA